MMDKLYFNTIKNVHKWKSARDFLKQHAVATGRKFTLKSGRESDFYVDCRVAALVGHRALAYDFSTPLSALIQHVIQRVEETKTVDAWAPVPLGGVLLMLRTSQSIPAVVPRTEQKGHGMQRKIEGLYNASGERTLPEDARVFLIEDVITSGGSTIAAAETLRREKLNPIGAVVLVDREEGGREALEQQGLEVWPIFVQSDLREEQKNGS